MIHHNLLNQIRRTCRRDDFLYPYYDHYSIAEVVPTVWSLFGIEQPRKILPFMKKIGKPKKVILLVVDGFAYKHFIKHYKELPFLNRLVSRGNVYPITSVFPSTTAAALTCLHTGLTPQEHALPEWNVYFQEFDRIIETLPFKTWDMAERDGLLRIGGTATMLYEGPTAYQVLQQHGVNSYIFIYQDYTHTAYSDSVHRGGCKIPYSDSTDLMQRLMETLRQEAGPTYYFAYWGHIDTTAHKFGSDTPEHVRAITQFAETLEQEFMAKLDTETAQDVLFLLTADHGHANIKREDIINLNKYEVIEDNFLVSSRGKRILPTGSPHDVFLFIEPEKIKDVVAFLREELVGKAEVILTQDAIERGLFGVGEPTQKFLNRVGNVIILPYAGYHIWYEFLPDTPFSQLGVHGGLSEEEMTVPFASVRLTDLLF